MRSIARSNESGTAGEGQLVTNDRHLLALNPYEGLRIISLSDYWNLLVDMGLMSP